jgi:hypothetical protein
MNRFPVVCLLLAWTSTVVAQETKDVFAELDAQIEKQLSSDEWHPASKSFIRTQWDEFKRAHEKPGQRADFYGAKCYGGIACGPDDIEEIRQYAGGYNFKPSGAELSPGPDLQIDVSLNNRLFVVEDGCRMPVVVNNKIIFFTSGKLVKENAQLGSKPYARLEMHMVYKARHFGYVTGPVDSFVDDMLELVKKADQNTPKGGKKHEPIDIRTLLEKGQASGSLPEGMVIRIGACLGASDVKASGDRVSEQLKETWEFTSNQVHRVVFEYKEDKITYHRVESRPFDSKGICKDLLEGKAIEIRARKGEGPKVGFVGTSYHLGSRSIEVVWNGETILDLHEIRAAFPDLYRESDARAFGALYERLASQARVLFTSKADETK